MVESSSKLCPYGIRFQMVRRNQIEQVVFYLLTGSLGYVVWYIPINE